MLCRRAINVLDTSPIGGVDAGRGPKVSGLTFDEYGRLHHDTRYATDLTGLYE
jgi:hypothetical protein